MRLIESGSFPMADIIVGERLRAIDENWAQGLAAEFKEREMHNPVKLMVIGNQHHLSEGGHRYRAHQIMGRNEIYAKAYQPETEFPMDELRLHEIDENLMRRELSTLDRAACIVERKRILRKLHGETRGRKPGKEPNMGLFSINEDVAAKMGFSKSTVKALEGMYEGLSAATRKRVAATYLADNRAQLVQLSKVDAEAQKAALDILLAREPKATNVSGALALHLNKVDVKNPDEIAFARFVKLWGGASRKVKRQISSYIAKATP